MAIRSPKTTNLYPKKCFGNYEFFLKKHLQPTAKCGINILCYSLLKSQFLYPFCPTGRKAIAVSGLLAIPLVCQCGRAQTYITNVGAAISRPRAIRESPLRPYVDECRGGFHIRTTTTVIARSRKATSKELLERMRLRVLSAQLAIRSPFPGSTTRTPLSS